MRYEYIKRANGSYDPVLKWERPVDYKLEYLSMIIGSLLVGLITFWATILLTI